MNDLFSFLETANLDGESNLKLRAAHPRTVEANTIQEIQNLSIEVDADEPCRRLYEFDGSIILNEEEELPLTIDNFLHRGTTLKKYRIRLWTRFVYWTSNKVYVECICSSPQDEQTRIHSESMYFGNYHLFSDYVCRIRCYWSGCVRVWNCRRPLVYPV